MYSIYTTTQNVYKYQVDTLHIACVAWHFIQYNSNDGNPNEYLFQSETMQYSHLYTKV